MRSRNEMYIQNLKVIRKKRKLSQVTLSKLTGIEQGLISKYETGRHKAGLIQRERLAEVLHCETFELINLTTGPSPNGTQGRGKKKVVEKKAIDKGI